MYSNNDLHKLQKKIIKKKVWIYKKKLVNGLFIRINQGKVQNHQLDLGMEILGKAPKLLPPVRGMVISQISLKKTRKNLSMLILVLNYLYPKLQVQQNIQMNQAALEKGITRQISLPDR